MRACPHCAEQVQAAAKLCPHCRKDLREHRLKGCIAGVLGMFAGMAVLIAVVSYLLEEKPKPTPAPQTTSQSAKAPGSVSKPPISKTPSTRRPPAAPRDNLEAQRAAFVQKLVNLGVFRRVSFGAVAKVWVDERFLSLDFEDKKKFCGVIYAAGFGQVEGDVVSILDVRSGKELGEFTVYGLRMY